MLFTVSVDDTAVALGSGELQVLGTPRLLAWLEAATVRAAAPLLTPGQTTVGTAVRIRHRRPSHVGERVEVLVDDVNTSEGSRLTFAVRAIERSGSVIADGQIDRAIVESDRFLQTSSE